MSKFDAGESFVKSIRVERNRAYGMLQRTFLALRVQGVVVCLAFSAIVSPGLRAQDLESSQPEALGVIVKLRSSSAVTPAQPAALFGDPAQLRRLRLAGAAQRARVSYLIQKDTAQGAHVLHLGHPTSLSQAKADAARLRADPDVEWAVPNEMHRPAVVTTGQPVPTTTAYAGRYWAYGGGQGREGVANFPAAWAFLFGRQLNPVVTAVLDSGITDVNHPDFSGRLFPGFDFVADTAASRDGNGRDTDVRDEGDYTDLSCSSPLCRSSWHGTSITAMLSAPGTSDYNASGGVEAGPGILAPIQSQPVVLPVRIGGAGGAATSDIIDAMYWAAGFNVPNVSAPPPNPYARVISISYGSVSDCLGGAGTVDALFRDAIATLRTLGVVVVASAGNGDQNQNQGFTTPSRPASCQGVIAVTALRASSAKASYANLVDGRRAGQCYFGVGVAAGDDGEPLALLSNDSFTTQGNTKVLGGLAGTSFAAPQVAGVAALMLALKPELSSVDVAYRIMESSRAFDTSPPGVMNGTCAAGNTEVCVCTEATCGRGVLDAPAALNAALAPPALAEGSCPGIAVRARSGGGGGGGGGSSDTGFLLSLAAAAGWLLRRRVADHVGRITSGKP